MASIHFLMPSATHLGAQPVWLALRHWADAGAGLEGTDKASLPSGNLYSSVGGRQKTKGR